MSRFEKYVGEMCGKSHDKKKKKKKEVMENEDRSNALAKKLVSQWKQIAGETVEVEYIKGGFFGFCSELGSYRLFMKYSNKGKNNPKVGAQSKFDVGFSPTKKKHYFKMEV